MSQSLYEATWESLQNYRVPGWFENAKLGVFIHWGVYCVPAFDNEWYSRNMYQKGSRAYEHHRATFGDQTVFGYKDFIPKLTGSRFDAGEWIRLFKQAGARYVVPVAQHHDGFAMYPTAYSTWNAFNMGPKRDVIGELQREAAVQGLTFGVSNHHAENWWFFDGGREFASDVQDPNNRGLYGVAAPSPSAHGFESPEWNSKDWTPRPTREFLNDWYARCIELVERYQPRVFYFDWWIQQEVFEPYRRKFAAEYYNRVGSDAVLTYKHDSYPAGTAVFDIERGKLADIRVPHWQTDTSLGYKSWCHIEDEEYRTPESLIHLLADIVSKNGNLLINVGPKADGTLPDESAGLLRELGAWLAVNGAAIYDTQHWERFGEGDTPQVEGYMSERGDKPFTATDIRFTVRGDALYAICLGWPGEETVIRSLKRGSALTGERLEKIEMLGAPGTLAWSQDEQGLHIRTPDARPPCEHAYVYKLTLKRP